MAHERAYDRQAATSLRRAAVASRAGAAASSLHPAQLLQRRLGHAGTARLLARRALVGVDAPSEAERRAAADKRGSAAHGIAGIQRAPLHISSPNDPAEHEANRTAAHVMRMADPVTVARSTSQEVRRATLAVQRKAADPASAPASLAAELTANPSGGMALPDRVRRFMEPRFGADFRAVRIHVGEHAARLSQRVSARAFTLGKHIYFAHGAYQPDSLEGRELIAHELTHTLQQGAASVRRVAAASVDEHRAPAVQRSWLGDAVGDVGARVRDYAAHAAENIPGFRMFTILLGTNPITGARVPANAANLLRACVEFIPGGALLSEVLDRYGVFERAGSYVEAQLRALGISAASIQRAVDAFIAERQASDILHLGRVWDSASRIFTDPIDRIFSLLQRLGSAVLRFVRDAALRPLAELAKGTRGWDLLCAVLGQNPITGEPVARTPETLIGGFMKLIGQEEIWQNIQRSNAVARAWAWFQGALHSLLGFVRRIPGLFMQALAQLELADLLLLPRAFARVAGTLAGFIGELVSWAGESVWNLLEIVFSVVAPGVMVYLQRARAAFRKILSDPIGFLRNLLAAARQGLNQFVTNFVTHLRTSLVGWLTGALSGANIYIPQAFTLPEILKFVLSVLGLTWQNIRQKLVRAIGETAVHALEIGFDLVVTLVREGPAAAWQKIVEGINNLREMVIEQVMSFVQTNIVQAAITRLLSLLSPVGAFIQAIIGIYNTVMFFIERMQQIAQVAASFIDSLSAIANGVITAAANRVEQTMAGLLTLVISFLARIAGLGRVSDAVIGIVNRVRQPIDKALDRVVEWVVAQARRVGRAVAGGVRALVLRFTRPRSFSAAGETHETWITEGGEPQSASRAMTLAQRLAGWRSRLRTLSKDIRSAAAQNLSTASQLNRELREAAQIALRARAAHEANAVDTAQATIDVKQAALLPILAELFRVFGDVATAHGATSEAEIFAMVETYDQVVVPLKRRGLVAGSPVTLRRSFRGQWNAKMIPKAMGWLFQMERVLAAARNVGTGRRPYLTGVEVRIAGTRMAVDYTVCEREDQRGTAIEVKRYGPIRERTDRDGRVITVSEQIAERVDTITRQVTTALGQPGYNAVRLEMRGFDALPANMQQQLLFVFATLENRAAGLQKRFSWVRA
jgi:hypothetical protein